MNSPYERIEKIIREQLKAGNYKSELSYFDLGIYDASITIPKTKNAPKIVIDFRSPSWNEEELKYVDRSFHNIESIALKSGGWFGKTQYIFLHEEDTKTIIEQEYDKLLFNESQMRVIEKKQIDKKWSEKFNKAFSNT